MIRDISIKPVLNGFICKVGCQQVVFESVASLVQNLEAYLKDPSAVEKQFILGAVNKMTDGPQCMPTACDEADPTPAQVRSDSGQCESRGPQPIERREVRVSESLRSTLAR